MAQPNKVIQVHIILSYAKYLKWNLPLVSNLVPES